MDAVPLIEIKGLESGYGRIKVLSGIDLTLGQSECVGVLGHNGMGKTTLLKAIVGHLPITAGSMMWEGRPVQRLSAHQRSRLGLGYVPQGRQIFPALSVRDNLRFAIAAKGLPDSRLDEVLVDFPELTRLLERQGGALSGGEQQILSLARALCGKPRILLLDEPTEGIQPSIVEAIIERIDTLRTRHGLNVLLVEQNLDFIRGLAGRVLLLQRGRIAREIATKALADDALLEEFAGLH